MPWPVIALVRSLAGEERDQLVLAVLEVAEVDALDAAAVQRLDLERRIEIVGDDLVVELHLHGIELEHLADVHRHEHGHLRVRRKQQLFLEQEQILVEIEDLLLEVLHIGIERVELSALGGLRATGFRIELGDGACRRVRSHLRPCVLRRGKR